MMEAHLATTHEQYEDGFPERLNDDLLGHWETSNGVVVVEHHPHGYEVHFAPCYDFTNCDACAPDRGPSNPHTPDDGHHFRECESHGVILTVAGGEEGYSAVLQYLAWEGSPTHAREWALREVAEAEAEKQFRAEEQAENERALAEAGSQEPSIEERFAALSAEFEAFRERYERRPTTSS